MAAGAETIEDSKIDGKIVEVTHVRSDGTEILCLIYRGQSSAAGMDSTLR